MNKKYDDCEAFIETVFAFTLLFAIVLVVIFIVSC